MRDNDAFFLSDRFDRKIDCTSFCKQSEAPLPRILFNESLLLKGVLKISTIKVVDSRPARSAGRVKKKLLQNPLKIFVCHKGSILSSKVIKIHPVFLADEFSISKNTHNANFTKIWLKQAF